MQRRPEPEELMDEPAQARAYAEADFSEPNTLFVELLERLAGGRLAGRFLDLGCGPADIPLRLLARHDALHVDAVDGARAMLDLARAALDRSPRLRGRLTLRCEHLPLHGPAVAAYDGVVSNSLLHHLADPATLWQTVLAAARPGAGVLVMDLHRPDSPDSVDDLVARYADGAPTVLREDFRNSLYAAYTVDEIRAQLARAGLDFLDVARVSDRHVAVSGRLPD
jgi:SAM-dependent methyltransferase